MLVSISQEKPWMKYYPEAARMAQLPKCTAYQHLRWENAGNLGKNALNYYGAKITFRELFERIEAIASAFSACGVKEGDVVSFLTVAVPESIASVYALNKLGAAVNTIDPRLDVESIERMIVGSGSKILVAIDAAWPKVARILDEINQDCVVVQSAALSLPPLKRVLSKLGSKVEIPYGGKVVPWGAFAAKGRGAVAPEAPYQGDRVFSISYTGGTTNAPKGVMLTNDSVNAVSFNFKHAGVARMDPDRFLGIIPIFTAYGMVCGLHMPLCFGFELVPIPKFDVARFGKLVRKFKPNHVISTPAFYEDLMEDVGLRGYDLSFLVTAGSGGDTMNDGLEKRFRAFLKDHGAGHSLVQGYGMSEASAAVSFCTSAAYKRGSVGVPSLSTVISVFDPETGEELEPNQVGEVCVSGPTLMKGYFNRPEETAAALRAHADGTLWLHSGDLGLMDEGGFLFIKGRVKRMITRFDGHKVFPANIEGIVAGHEDVRNVCVVGVDDLRHSNGQYPLVLVEFVDGCDGVSCRELYRECLERFEERGRPVAVLAVDEIPLTGSGKNDFKALERRYSSFDYEEWARSL